MSVKPPWKVTKCSWSLETFLAGLRLYTLLYEYTISTYITAACRVSHRVKSLHVHLGRAKSLPVDNWTKQTVPSTFALTGQINQYASLIEQTLTCWQLHQANNPSYVRFDRAKSSQCITDRANFYLLTAAPSKQSLGKNAGGGVLHLLPTSPHPQAFVPFLASQKGFQPICLCFVALELACPFPCRWWSQMS